MTGSASPQMAWISGMAIRAMRSMTTPRVRAIISSLADLSRMNCTVAKMPNPETTARQSQP